jgi:hypothetical protein
MAVNVENIPLKPYGILQEQSDIRVHVSISTRAFYVFKTAGVRDLIISNPDKYKIAKAKQPGVVGVTAEGWLVPVEDVPDLRRVEWNEGGFPWWDSFSEEDATSEKGRKATMMVKFLLKKGLIPLWAESEEPSDNNIQIMGVDIILIKNLRLQVKCDWRCGPRPDGSGNFFIQKAEINPMKKF